MLFNKGDRGDEEIKNLAPWTGVFSFSNLTEAVEEATDWLERVIGESCVTALDTFYHSAAYDSENPSDDDAKRIQAVEYAQRILLNYAFRQYAPKGNVLFENTGISQKYSDELRPATVALVPLMKSLYESAFLFLSRMIRYFEKDKVVFAKWLESPAKQNADKALIRDAYQFSDIYQIDNSFGFYYYTLDKQLRVQREKVKPVLASYWDDVYLLAHSDKLIESAETVATIADLPASATVIYLVEEDGYYYQYADSEWIKFALNLSSELELARQIIANGTIALKIANDYTELQHIGGDKISRLEAQLAVLENMRNKQEILTNALTDQLHEMILARDVIEEDIVEPIVPGNAYLPSASSNSIML